MQWIISVNVCSRNVPHHAPILESCHAMWGISLEIKCAIEKVQPTNLPSLISSRRTCSRTLIQITKLIKYNYVHMCTQIVVIIGAGVTIFLQYYLCEYILCNIIVVIGVFYHSQEL